MTSASDAVGCLSPSVAMPSRYKTSQRKPAHTRTWRSWHAWMIHLMLNHFPINIDSFRDMPATRRVAFTSRSEYFRSSTGDFSKKIHCSNNYLKYVKSKYKFPKICNFSCFLAHTTTKVNILRTRHVKKCCHLLLSSFLFSILFVLSIFICTLFLFKTWTKEYSLRL